MGLADRLSRLLRRVGAPPSPLTIMRRSFLFSAGLQDLAAGDGARQGSWASSVVLDALERLGERPGREAALKDKFHSWIETGRADAFAADLAALLEDGLLRTASAMEIRRYVGTAIARRLSLPDSLPREVHNWELDRLARLIANVYLTEFRSAAA